MLEIYTRESWVSSFRYPSIIVDDKGFIYNDDDYRKLIRNPIGKIDYNTGYIYGENYLELIPNGKFIKDGAITMVFGEDYYKNIRYPSFYVKGNEVYSYEEYHKTFPTPSYYIKSDAPQNNSSTNPVSNSNNTNHAKNTNVNDSAENVKKDSALFAMLKPILIVLALAFLSCGFFYNFVQDSVYGPIFLVALPVGFIAAFVLGKDSATAVLYAEVASVIVFWIGVMAIDLPDATGLMSFAIIFINPFLIALMMAVPSIVIGLIVYGIKKLFKK